MPAATLPVALITGASGDLGATVTGMFRGAGFRVSAIARKWKDIGDADPDLLLIPADLTARSGAEAAVRRTLAAFGQIDAFVHLAGGFAGGSNTEDTAEETWDHMLNLNLQSAIHMMRAVIPGMRAKGRGRIVMIGSKAAVEPVAGLSAYAASKAALLAVVRVAAAELKNNGITVNALLPSTIDTISNRETMGESQAVKWVQPASVGSLLLWLCSDAGRDVTGALIPVYGRI
jgi:NAD(P)-dependent dehydrogenase (short-subunit alcohol dehydrogenase family)